MQRPSVATSKPAQPVAICLVGVGLIGGSLGMALRRVRRGGHRAYHVTGLGRSNAGLREATRLGAIDAGSVDVRQALSSAGIVVLCVPVQDILAVARKLVPHLQPGTILTDVGSVKGPVVAGMKKILSRRRDVRFVGGHPMAGSEKKGVRHATASLFRGATCVLTSSPREAKSIQRLWRDAGAKCLALSAERHDHWIAVTSHLPHLLAFSLMSKFSDAAVHDPKIKSLAAGSFRDMTRVAGADPKLWSGVITMNRSALAAAFKDFSRRAAALAGQDIAVLRRSLSRVAAAKKALK